MAFVLRPAASEPASSKPLWPALALGGVTAVGAGLGITFTLMGLGEESELEGVSYEETRFEGYAPGGVAVIVDCLTDNRNRTVADVRHAFSKHGGNLGTDGSVAFMFRKLGVLSFAPGCSEDAVMEAALEAGADDVVVFPEDGSIEVLTQPETFEAVRDAMAAAGQKPDEAEITLRADTDVTVEGDTAKAVAKLLDRLESLDDVQEVYSNADLPADAYE
mgnify:CR=1 FL=1